MARDRSAERIITGLGERLPATPAGIARAVALLREGHLVAIPTETVYGLAADAADARAVAAIFAAKGRPAFNPLIAHVGGRAMADALADFPPLAAMLADRFWPGPLTLVLDARADARIAALARAGLPTIAIRAPAHPVAREIIEGVGRPLVAPSANPSGRLSPTRAEHVAAGLPYVALLDGGPCGHGLESTIVGIAGEHATLLRPGAIPAEALGVPVAPAGPGIASPGQLAHHYAPVQPLRLNATHARPGEYLIGFGAVAGDRNLSPAADPTEAAAALFEALHAAQASGRPAIAVAPIPMAGLGVAINDRLARAAAPRPPTA